MGDVRPVLKGNIVYHVAPFQHPISRAKWELSEYPIKVNIMFNSWVRESSCTLENNLCVLTDGEITYLCCLPGKNDLCPNGYPCGQGVLLRAHVGQCHLWR